ncbi:MAG: hypothetical protein FWC43_02830 [Planctomycetaceae bacterium]|nr:hypothetical protein [Planctomycetaceae bacterium]
MLREVKSLACVCFCLFLSSLALAEDTGHWSFDDQGDVAGVFGNAFNFPLKKPLSVEMDFLPQSRELDQITISAWIRPTAFERYNEIFRQECQERLLFSLQEHATILSLGLNIGGYEECDAPIDRDALLDGNWHYAVGTFDGQTMRVYLDGKEIHSLVRPGKITVNPTPKGFIGSSSGNAELFVGDIDELKIAGRCDSATKIIADYQAGIKALDEHYAVIDQEIQKFYVVKPSFAETLAASRAAWNRTWERTWERRHLACTCCDGTDGQAGSLRSQLAAKLRNDFPEEANEFLKQVGYSPVKIILESDLSELRSKVEQIVLQMTEYKPITEEQWRLAAPEDRQKWEKVEQRQQEFLQNPLDGSAQSLTLLVELLKNAKEVIQERPQVREAVAPWSLPKTPEPRTYSAEEAEKLLRDDWLFQCDGKPTVERILDEIQRSHALKERFNYETAIGLNLLFSRFREQVEKQNLTPEECTRLYFAVRDLKRQIMLANPVLDFSKILLVDMPYPAGSEWNHETRHRLGYMAIPGGQLLVLNGLTPLKQNVWRLMPQEPLHGSFWRPDVSFDGKRVLFSFKPHNEKAFNIYEINVDGSGLRQITAGMFDDLDPVYLPDGKNFVFSTSRSYTYVRCMPPTNAFVLARCALDGDDVYLISQNNEPDYLPSVLNDGRIIYTRWEYTDKPLWRCQSLWTANPDGTMHSTFWGNQSVWPDLLKDARSIPGSTRVMFTGSAHHDWFAGSIGIITPEEGNNFPHGLTKVTADAVWPETGNGPVDPIESPHYYRSGNFTAYYSPYPLSEKDFLVSARKNGKFMLYLMDVDGNRELIYEGVNNIFHAIPIHKRVTPPVIPDRTLWPTYAERENPKPGTIFSGNVYHGAPAELKDKAKFLRVLNIEPKTYTNWDNRPYISTGPVVSMVQSEGVKRILGTVPIEEDGSIWFTAPSGVALHFQLLDGHHRALQTMRSFTGLMPGEDRGCLGCHESHSVAPTSELKSRSLALQKSPQAITPVPWAFDDIPESQHHLVARQGTSISYKKDVRPVLDRYCAECHEGDGEGRQVFDTTERPGFLMFSEPYVTMIGAPNWGAPGNFPTGAWGGGRNVGSETLPPGFDIAGTLHVEAFDQRDPNAYITLKPMTSLSYKSRLIELASSGEHYDLKMDSVSLLKLILWVDAICPYIDDSHIRSVPDPVFQGSDWLSVPPRLETAPSPVRPGPFRAKSDVY